MLGDVLRDLTEGQRRALLDLAHAYHGRYEGWSTPDDVDGRSARGLVRRGLAQGSTVYYRGARHPIYRLTDRGRSAVLALLKQEEIRPPAEDLRAGEYPETENGRLARVW